MLTFVEPGTHPFKPTLVAIKGIVFDVSRNPAYGPNGPYHGMQLTSSTVLAREKATF